MYRSLTPATNDIYAHFDRLQQEMDQWFGGFNFPASIRAVAQGSFPAVNVYTRPDAVDVAVFAPGIDPGQLNVTMDRGVLTISGSRDQTVGGDGPKNAVFAQERFTGQFKRSLTLPEDVDANRAEAKYVDGVLTISVPRNTPPQPQRIAIR